MLDLFAGAKLALVGQDDADPFCVPLPIFFGEDGANDRPLQFTFKDADLISEWALLGADDTILDSGKLTRERRVGRGDRIVFPRGAVKSAIIGDLLGITAVFMPSGFVVGVPPVTAKPPGGELGGTLGDFAYAGQDERPAALPFWLPKRRWNEMPRYLDEYGTWQKRLGPQQTRCREKVVRRQTEVLVAAGVL